MASTETENDVAPAAPDAVQDESNILEEPSALREENNEDKEEGSATQSTSKPLDNKGATDPKNPSVRIVRGTKKMRLDIDSNHASEKKGTFMILTS